MLPVYPVYTKVLSPPWGRELERGQQAARLVFGRFGCWERLPKFGKCPLPSPPPKGEGEREGGHKSIQYNILISLPAFSVVVVVVAVQFMVYVLCHRIIIISSSKL